jgi:alpha-D-ribose 1-methylphosphonate 5-triphosphate diphosphatase
MASETILTNARIVTSDAVLHGTLRIADGRIADVAAGPSRAAGAVDCEGDLLLPGLVELHTDNLEKHFSPRPGVIWPSLPALAAHDAQLAAAGITTVLDALAIGEYREGSVRRRILTDSAEAIRRGRTAGALRVDHYLHMRLEISDPAVVDMFQPFAEDPLVRMASLMDHTPGQRQWWSLEKYQTFNAGKMSFANEAELHAYVASRIEQQQRWAGPNRQALVALCRAHGILMASHDDTTEEHVAEAADDAIAISEFPTTEAAARAARAHGMAVVMGAPNVVRGGSHSGNVSAEGLAGAGLLDALASDYVPASLLHGALLLESRLGIALPDAVATVTANPARMAGFDDRGEIEPGKRADLVRVTMAGGGDQGEDVAPLIRTVWRAGERIF